MSSSITEEAEATYYKHYNEAENYLAQYGDDGISRNIGVTQSYNSIAEQDPYFMWFHAATTGSYQVGEALRTTQNPLVQNCNSTQTLADGLSWGNQAIHNNMLALYFTYKEIGLEGLAALAQDSKDSGQLILSPQGFAAFTMFDELNNQAIQIAQDLSEQSDGAFVSHTDPIVITEVFANPEGLDMAKQASLLATAHEQLFVSPMYDMTFFLNGPTVGEVMDDNGVINSLANMYAEANHITGAQIYDDWVSMTPYTFSDYDERMEYFESVFDVFFNISSQENGLLVLSAQRNGYVSGLEIDFIPYNIDYQVAPPSSSEALASMEDSPSHIGRLPEMLIEESSIASVDELQLTDSHIRPINNEIELIEYVPPQEINHLDFEIASSVELGDIFLLDAFNEIIVDNNILSYDSDYQNIFFQIDTPDYHDNFDLTNFYISLGSDELLSLSEQLSYDDIIESDVYNILYEDMFDYYSSIDPTDSNSDYLYQNNYNDPLYYIEMFESLNYNNPYYITIDGLNF